MNMVFGLCVLVSVVGVGGFVLFFFRVAPRCFFVGVWDFLCVVECHPFCESPKGRFPEIRLVIFGIGLFLVFRSLKQQMSGTSGQDQFGIIEIFSWGNRVLSSFLRALHSSRAFR